MSENENRKSWNKPVTTDRARAILLITVVFFSGMYFQQVMIGLFYMPYFEKPAPSGSNNNNSNNSGTTQTTTSGNSQTTTVANPGAFKVVSFESGYDSSGGTYYIRFAVTVSEQAGTGGTCHLYCSVLEKSGKVHASDQYVQLDAYSTLNEVFTWEVDRQIWEQDRINWSTASVIVVN